MTTSRTVGGSGSAGTTSSSASSRLSVASGGWRLDRLRGPSAASGSGRISGILSAETSAAGASAAPPRRPFGGLLDEGEGGRFWAVAALDTLYEFWRPREVVGLEVVVSFAPNVPTRGEEARCGDAPPAP